ncbi:hypothetical protein [Amycolatopsis kentuckyensis]|uniref:hypothetical protein n=1 Tax=Amycolatopsis kentuckyensis TaxID=218823 RepID=UPI0035671D76
MSETQGDGEGFSPGSNPYGHFPAAPPYAHQPARPEPVRRAAFAWWGGVACWFLGSLLSQLLDSTRMAPGPLPVDIAVLTFLLPGALWALLVYGMYRGAGWARKVLAIAGVLGIFNVVFQLLWLATADPMLGGDVAHLGFFLAALGLSITGFVLMYRDGTAPYFVRRR